MRRLRYLEGRHRVTALSETASEKAHDFEAWAKNHPRRHMEQGLFRASRMVSFHRHHSARIGSDYQLTLGG